MAIFSNIQGIGIGCGKKLSLGKLMIQGVCSVVLKSEKLIEAGGYYSSNQLIAINVMTDENNNGIGEHKDKMGRIILKKVQVLRGTADLNNRDQWALTYYAFMMTLGISALFFNQSSRN